MVFYVSRDMKREQGTGNGEWGMGKFLFYSLIPLIPPSVSLTAKSAAGSPHNAFYSI
jgi:hypothetical protein